MNRSLTKVNYIAATLLLLLVVMIYSMAVNYHAHTSYKTDLQTSYLSGVAYVNGHNPYFLPAYDTTHHQVINVLSKALSPPTQAMLFGGLSLFLSLQSITILWLTISIIAGLIAIHFCEKYFLEDNVGAGTIYRVVFFLLIPPAYVNITYGQSGLLLCLIIYFAIYFLREKRLKTAAILFALATSFKLFFLFFCIYFVAKKQYKLLCYYLLFTVLLLILPVINNIPNTIHSYLLVLQHINWYQNHLNASLKGFLFRLAYDKTQLLTLANISYYFLAACYTLLAFMAIRKNEDFLLNISITLSTMLLVSPLGWSYYFLLLYLPFMYLNKKIMYQKKKKITFTLLYSSLFLACFAIPFNALHKMSYLAVSTLNNTGFFALFIFTNLALYLCYSSSTSLALRFNPVRVKRTIIGIIIMLITLTYSAIFLFFAKPTQTNSITIYQQGTQINANNREH